jgi:hypothetical protein
VLVAGKIKAPPFLTYGGAALPSGALFGGRFLPPVDRYSNLSGGRGCGKFLVSFPRTPILPTIQP